MPPQETIGDRRRNAAEGRIHQIQTIPLSPLSRDIRTEPYQGRHRPEYILSQGEKPNYINKEKTPPIPEPTPATSPPAEEPQPPSVTVFPQRIPMTHIVPELLAVPTPSVPKSERNTLASPPPKRRRPTETQGPVPNKESVPVDKPVPAINGVIVADNTKTIEPHKKQKKSRKRTIALATAAAVAGATLIGGGLTIFKDKKTAPPPSNHNATQPFLPDKSQPLEPPQIPPVHIENPSTITTEDGNQWSTTANKVQDTLSHPSIPVTNIFAKLGAYEVIATSPNPDSAKPGDQFPIPTEPAIRLVDRLQQPLGPNATVDEKEAARLISKLNNLAPMETKQVIDLYGDDILALKLHLTNIITAEQTKDMVSFQAPKRSEVPTSAKAQETTVFARAVDKVTNLIKRDPQTKAKKAMAEMTKDYQKRQKQTSYAA